MLCARQKLRGAAAIYYLANGASRRESIEQPSQISTFHRVSMVDLVGIVVARPITSSLRDDSRSTLYDVHRHV